MKRSPGLRPSVIGLQRGAVAVEFALISALFLITLLVGILELGRVFYYMNATAEATRLGARLAVVCDKSPAQQNVIRDRMRGYLDVLPAASISFAYSPANCIAGTCRTVTVSVLPGATFETVIPFVPLTWPILPFATTLPTESLDSTSNSVCQ